MATRYFGAPVTRNEDGRLLSGRALFVDDIDLPNMLHAALVRSPHAHARIRAIDVLAALRRPGVVAVYTAADLGEVGRPGPLLVPPPPIKDLVFHERTQVPLAKDTVKHVGEPVAFVVAESRYIAEDAVADVVVDYDPLRAVVELDVALQSQAPLVHDDLR
ncbi:MAG: xanthine dehydrogenase family protein molybdopterin-binding subunit, partial [Alphaproteobacteria bacterium]|nr:xanthine dehydrogenase family protein molybdopterin-binding subunit [Alphaproteobacteria bacterium]